ncbi:unnamed protein product [Euphydryas editha]|uniref:Acyl-CoA oxidase C-terminal domain-containing protein n=1 Tax=Euphydryas editha TaxID=104508 RepID=A0AAU9V1I7_EUPED|nr:unnamed protein product [Euphydryas editha]
MRLSLFKGQKLTLHLTCPSKSLSHHNCKISHNSSRSKSSNDTVRGSGFLAKSWNGIVNGKKLPPTVAFLADYWNKNVKPWNDSLEGIVEGFKTTAAGKIKAACDSIQAYLDNGRQFEDAWNLCSVQLVTASEAYARYLLCDIFWRETQNMIKTTSKDLGVVLLQLAELYLVYWALEKRGDLLTYTTISKDNIELLQTRYEELLGLIRPNAVPLVDAFDIRDEILCSTLGAYDGRVYERLMEDASKSPLNKQVVNDSFHKYTKPFMIKHKL